MLRQRLVTAAILLPLFLAAIWFFPPSLFAGLIGLIILVGAWEFSRMIRFSQSQRLYYLALLAGIMAGLYWIATPSHLLPLFLIVTGLWILGTAWLLNQRHPLTTLATAKRWLPVVSSLILLTAWLAMLQIHQVMGPTGLLGLLCLIWAIDTGAYFAGRRWGKRRLAPHVSPGKTWAGVVGALMAATVWAIAFGVWHSMPLWGTILGSWVLTGLAIGGDLGESWLKRRAQVKDSGTLLPGHGGILDRIDSTLATAPAFAVGTYLLEWSV